MATPDKKPGGKNVIEMPDGPPDASGLTPRQQRVLATIKDSIETKGYPPSMREIGQAVGLTSSSSVAQVLGPTMPSAVRPFAFWYSLTALAVLGPNSPSTSMS